MLSKSDTNNCKWINKKKNIKTADSEITYLQHQLFNEGIVSRTLLDAIPSPLLIINEQWQVIYANPAVRFLVNQDGALPLKGFAEGEPFYCLHARSHLQEAGKHECCRICGVARVLSKALKGEESSEDCHLDCELTGATSSLDLRVSATPLESQGERYSILSLIDISDKQKRAMLENICFHDLLNTLTSIKGFLGIMKEEDFDDRGEICDLLERTTQSSIDEIMDLRLLEKVEQKELDVRLELMESAAFLELMAKTLKRHPKADGKELSLSVSDSGYFRADPRLLRRIISNMLINAFEATPAGGQVTLGCRIDASILRFWVHNHQVIPEGIREKLFQKAISSKGQGRGIGTYSIKLLSEMIGGDVYFTSTESEGTVFSLLLRRERGIVVSKSASEAG
jgi:hypothetical protein